MGRACAADDPRAKNDNRDLAQRELSKESVNKIECAQQIYEQCPNA